MGDYMEADVTILLALSAGVISFISPCTLPLYPAYLSYITGVSVSDLQNKRDFNIRKKVILHTIFFLLGISTIYIALAAGASFVGNVFVEYGQLIRQISALLIIVLGLFLVGFFKMEWLMKERRFQFSKKPVGYVGTTLIGMGFAAGWTPCLGPVISAILALGINNPQQSITYMVAYVIGFSIPFLVLAFFVGSTRWILKYSGIVMKIGGVIMIIMGVLLYTDQLDTISSYLFQLFEGTWITRIG